MTYAKKYGKYGLYAGGLLYRWFKSKEKAMEYWNEAVDSSSEAAEEWIEEYGDVSIRDMKTGEVIIKL
jgi:hypothetical protein